MPTARFGYDNIFEVAHTVSVTSENAAFPKENFYNWNSYDYFKPNAAGTLSIEAFTSTQASVNYFGIYAHTIGDVPTATAQLKYWNNSFWTNVGSAFVVDTNEVVFHVLGSTYSSGTGWGLDITSVTTDTCIGVASIGKTLDLPAGFGRGFTPPNLIHDNIYTNTISETGILLGRSVKRQSGKTNVRIDLLDPDWVRTDLEPFLTHAETKPFFMSWDYEGHPDESGFAWTQSRGLNSPTYNETSLMSINLKLNVITE